MWPLRPASKRCRKVLRALRGTSTHKISGPLRPSCEGEVLEQVPAHDPASDASKRHLKGPKSCLRTMKTLPKTDGSSRSPDADSSLRSRRSSTSPPSHVSLCLSLCHRPHLDLAGQVEIEVHLPTRRLLRHRRPLRALLELFRGLPDLPALEAVQAAQRLPTACHLSLLHVYTIYSS